MKTNCYIIPAIEDKCTKLIDAGNTVIVLNELYLELSYFFTLEEIEDEKDFDWKLKRYDSKSIILKKSITHIAMYYGQTRGKYCVSIHCNDNPSIIFESKDDSQAMYEILQNWLLQ